MCAFVCACVCACRGKGQGSDVVRKMPPNVPQPGLDLQSLCVPYTHIGRTVGGAYRFIRLRRPIGIAPIPPLTARAIAIRSGSIFGLYLSAGGQYAAPLWGNLWPPGNCDRGHGLVMRPKESLPTFGVGAWLLGHVIRPILQHQERGGSKHQCPVLVKNETLPPAPGVSPPTPLTKSRDAIEGEVLVGWWCDV
jgi:hypothetical protein